MARGVIDGETRAQAARTLLERLRQGPSFHFRTMDGLRGPEADAAQQYRLWAETWVIPWAEALVPELKTGRKD